MSKITNDGLTRSGTGCFLKRCTNMAAVSIKGLNGEYIMTVPLRAWCIYHETSLTKWSLSEIPAPASKMLLRLQVMKSVETTCSSVYPRMPFIGPSAAAFTAALIWSYDACTRATTSSVNSTRTLPSPVCMPVYPDFLPFFLQWLAFGDDVFDKI